MQLFSLFLSQILFDKQEPGKFFEENELSSGSCIDRV